MYISHFWRLTVIALMHTIYMSKLLHVNLNSPCTMQVANGFEDCADVLLQARADPTLKDHQGRTPVHFAALCGHFGLVETLIQHGGSPSTPDKHGYTPIHWAAYNGHDKCLEALLEVCSLVRLAWQLIDQLCTCFQKDGDISAGNEFSPLHCAV